MNLTQMDLVQAEFAAAFAALGREHIQAVVMEPWLELRHELAQPLAA